MFSDSKGSPRVGEELLGLDAAGAGSPVDPDVGADRLGFTDQ
jgi:hypothetical protein